VHWPTDVVGGALVGFLAASAVWVLLLRHKEGLVKQEEKEEEEKTGTLGDSLFPKISE